MTRLWWVTSLLLVWTPHSYCTHNNVTHEDIRDALLSTVHIIRTMDDKVERYAFRENAGVTMLKRTMAGLEKKLRALEPLPEIIIRLDERLSSFETLLQKGEREKTEQNNITTDTLNGIQKNLQALTASLNEKPASNITLNAHTLSSTEAKIDSIKTEIENLKNSLSKDNIRAMLSEIASEVNPLEKHISESEKLLNKFELKLSEHSNSAISTDVSLTEKAWQTNVTEAVNQVTAKLQELSERLVTSYEDIHNSLSASNNFTECAYKEMSTGYEMLRNEVQFLIRNNKPDSSAEQILAGVTELVHNQSSSFNKTVNDRFDMVQLAILDQQATVQKNFSDKVESVWSQIGVVHDQLSANKDSIEKLTVGNVIPRILEIDDNINRILGRLSLVTLEFLQIKTELDKVKSNLRTVQEDGKM